MPFDRLVVSDEDVQLPGFKTVVVPEITRVSDCSVPLGRNAGFTYAIEHGYDWVISFDCDAVLLSLNQLPEKTGFGTTQIFWGNQGEEDASAFDHSQTNRLRSGWFVLRRDIFEQPWCRLHEGYQFYGYEDHDFIQVCGQNGVHQSPCDIKTAHVWHPRTQDLRFVCGFERSRDLFNQRFASKS